MTRVAILPDALANQIAAGEVVERPASVVKELVENALDAEASRVVVTIASAGQRLIRVVDDGLGMGREDAVLALRRHATSKIAVADDLLAIDTLGFRGEALPSIASVSRFRLVTRERDAAVATEVTVEGGGEPIVRDAGAPPGTCIEVADLFYNVPARLKFLKQPATEAGQVAALMTSFALGHPHVHFRFEKDGRVVADHPVARRLDQRVFQVLGRQVADRLHAVELDGPIRVRGYISEPTFTRTTQQNIHTFVNGRRVRDRTVTHAFMSAYGGMLQRGHFPQGVLYVHLDPRSIDVNVHPAKAEIRFVDGGAVHGAIARACRATLGAAPWRRSGPTGPADRPGGDLFGGVPGPAPPLPPSPMTERGPTSYQAGAGSSVFVLGERGDPADDRADDRADNGPTRAQELRFDLPVSPWARRPTPPLARATGREPFDSDYPRPEPGSIGTDDPFTSLRVVGVVARRFVACEGAGAVHFVDARAAERLIRQDRLHRALAAADAGESAPPSRPLLFPAQVELSPSDHLVLEAHATRMRRLGFDLEPFGGRTWQLLAVPEALGDTDPAVLLGVAVEVARSARAPAEVDASFIRALAAAADRDEALADPARARALLVALDELAGRADVHAVLVSLPYEALAR